MVKRIGWLCSIDRLVQALLPERCPEIFSGIVTGPLQGAAEPADIRCRTSGMQVGKEP
jgi:hypothetical protein